MFLCVEFYCSHRDKTDSDSPAAAHVAHGAAGVVAAGAPVPCLALAARLGPWPLRPLGPPVTLALRAAPGQRVALLHHH